MTEHKSAEGVRKWSPTRLPKRELLKRIRKAQRKPTPKPEAPHD